MLKSKTHEHSQRNIEEVGKEKKLNPKTQGKHGPIAQPVRAHA